MLIVFYLLLSSFEKLIRLFAPLGIFTIEDIVIGSPFRFYYSTKIKGLCFSVVNLMSLSPAVGLNPSLALWRLNRILLP